MIEASEIYSKNSKTIKMIKKIQYFLKYDNVNNKYSYI